VGQFATDVRNGERWGATPVDDPEWAVCELLIEVQYPRFFSPSSAFFHEILQSYDPKQHVDLGMQSLNVAVRRPLNEEGHQDRCQRCYSVPVERSAKLSDDHDL
jgi:hypothetical protein